MLDRMLANLLSNAVKFTPDGGNIVVRVENGPSDRRNGPRSRPHRDLRIVVEDSGVGMPLLDVRRATEPFLSKERPGLSATPQGDGIGLTIVRSMMDCHGGTLTLEPAPRGGLRAVLTFPAARVL